MLGRKNYTQEELETFEPLFFNNMIMVLDRRIRR